MFFDVLRIVLVLALFEYLVRPSVKKARVCLTLRQALSKAHVVQHVK
jgi:hypothetical protein